MPLACKVPCISLCHQNQYGIILDEGIEMLMTRHRLSLYNDVNRKPKPDFLYTMHHAKPERNSSTCGHSQYWYTNSFLCHPHDVKVNALEQMDGPRSFYSTQGKTQQYRM